MGVVPEGYAKRPRWWHGNLFKAFYWACVGKTDALDRSVTEAKQQLADIQGKELRNTGVGCECWLRSIWHSVLHLWLLLSSWSKRWS